MEKTKKDIKASGWRIGIIVSIVLGLVMWTIIVPYTPTLVTDDNENEDASWHTVWKGELQEAFAEGTLASGASGITEIFFSNNTETPNSTYTVNETATIEGWCTAAHLGYSSTDDFYTELAHSTSFDIVVRVRANKTICASNTTDYGVFNGARLRVNITSASLSLGTLTPMIRVESYNDSTGIIDPYMYCNYYINWTGGTYTPTGTGFQITADSSNTITEIRFEAYY